MSITIDPDKPPANNENPWKRITLACHAVDCEPVKLPDDSASCSNLFFSIELTIAIPNMLQMIGSQSITEICKSEPLACLEYNTQSKNDHIPIPYNPPAKYTQSFLADIEAGSLKGNLNSLSWPLSIFLELKLPEYIACTLYSLETRSK